jgi:16S rRNA (adenine(1408)-N(1))-methyltransferase
VVVDVGTGGGGAVVRRARRSPGELVIGLDADASAMRDASRAAARAVRKGGHANAIFLMSAAEALPGPLMGRADLITVALPWGSLLRGLTEPSTGLLDALRAMLRPAGVLEVLLSVETLPALDGLLAAYGRVGLRMVERRAAEASDVERLSSAWGRRLGVPERRSAWLLRFARSEDAPLIVPAQ